MNIINDLLPFNDFLALRPLDDIDMLVFHCTELPTLADARRVAESSSSDGDSKCGISGHYYVDRDGNVYRYIEDNRIAHHVVSYNQRSIGIEFVNSGRYPNWYSTENQVCTEAYTDAQVKIAIELLYYLKRNIPSLQLIKRHSDLDTRWVVSSNNPRKQVRRKIDPGPLFPWNTLEKEWLKIL